MKKKDFSAEPVVYPAHRVRVSLAIYEKKGRQFKYVPGAFMVTCRDAEQRIRLWRVIEAAIAAGDWREPAHVRSAVDARRPGAGGEIRAR